MSENEYAAGRAQGVPPAIPEQTEIVIPGLGTVVDLVHTDQVAIALADVRLLEQKFQIVKKRLTEALVEHSQVQGTKTLHFPGGKVEIKGGSETVYDAEEIEQGLRAAGMPEERIREIVKETVSYKVTAVEAKKAAAANPEYAKVIEEHKRTVEKDPYAVVSRK